MSYKMQKYLSVESYTVSTDYGLTVALYLAGDFLTMRITGTTTSEIPSDVTSALNIADISDYVDATATLMVKKAIITNDLYGNVGITATGNVTLYNTRSMTTGSLTNISLGTSVTVCETYVLKH